MRILVESGGTSLDELGRTARALIEGMIPLARLELRRLRLPPLLASGVVYGVEEGERLSSPRVVMARGYADCMNLTLWHCAEQRERGHDARPIVRHISSRPGHRLWHVVTRLPTGEEFDTSAALGMHEVLRGKS